MSIPEDNYVCAIGKISVSMSNLELVLVYAISALIDKRYVETQLLIGGENFEILLSKLNKLFHYYIKDQLLIKQFESLHQEVKRVNTEKNKYTHASLNFDENNQVKAWKFSQRSGITFPHQAPVITLKELLILDHDISKTSDNLLDFILTNFNKIQSEIKKTNEEADKKIL